MISADEFKFYFLNFYMISNKIVSDLYMVSSRMINWVLSKTDGTSVITMNEDAI